MYKKSLILLSVLLYALPFFYPYYVWWLVFLFPVPLFYLALHKKLTCFDGYLWGVASFALHLAGVVLGMANMAQGQLIVRMLPGIALILYEGLYGGVWFWCMGFMQQILGIKQQSIALLCVWTLGLWVYIYVIDQYCLWIFHRPEGYFLMHPLLPLVVHPHILRLLPLVGKHILTWLWCCVPASLTAVLIWKNKLSYVVFLISLIPWIASYYMPINRLVVPMWLPRIASLPSVYPKGLPDAVAQTVADDFKRIVYTNKKIDIIILPESSFYTDAVFTQVGSLKQWSPYHIGKPLHILVGSFGWCDSAYHNCMYYVADGMVQTRFAKKHTMPVTECIPNWLSMPWLHTLYFSHMPPIVASDNIRPCIQIDANVRLVPYICSELFFQEWPDDVYTDVPILSLTNDRWCGLCYVQDLLYLAARFKAIQWQRDVLYVSYTYARWCDRYGSEVAF
ncbi:MAG TPA: hypothetical protein PLU71_02735 [Candidatus Dependentiae bacterium]|nr:hypothetical protein [Candidatus Dependentiae bacterium]HRQ62747.1 hypothetical protein [Candidatus Dependentiae bacterium]